MTENKKYTTYRVGYESPILRVDGELIPASTNETIFLNNNIYEIVEVCTIFTIHTIGGESISIHRQINVTVKY